jgi:hypothetical protein
VKPLALATKEEWDASCRMADAINLHVLAQNAQLGNGRDRPGYVAVRLEDGRSDGTLYDTRADATRHQSDPGTCYVKVGRQTMQPKEAWIVLQMNRQAYASGVVFTEEEVILPHRLELIAGNIPRTFRGVTGT